MGPKIDGTVHDRLDAQEETVSHMRLRHKALEGNQGRLRDGGHRRLFGVST